MAIDQSHIVIGHPQIVNNHPQIENNHPKIEYNHPQIMIDQLPIETFKCIACSSELPSLQSLEDHYATMHEEPITEVCFDEILSNIFSCFFVIKKIKSS